MKHLRHLLALALAAALTLMMLLPTYAAVIDGVYTDYMTGLKFTIPADWEEYAAPSTMPSYIKETFAYQKDGAFSMMGYGSVDLWMAALSNGQVSGTREELDNSAFTAEDIASLFGASSDIISTAAYGGVEYYTARITSSTNVSGTDFEATFLYALRIENGYLYLFYISEDADGPITGILSPCSPASGTPQRIPTHQSRPFPPAPPIPQRIVPPAAPHPAR